MTLRKKFMNKRLLLLITLASVSIASFAQDVKAKIDVQAKDPATKERAAKADVFIQNKHIIADTVGNDGGNTLHKKTPATIGKKKTLKKQCPPTGSK
jgi:hypothetical protein